MKGIRIIANRESARERREKVLRPPDWRLRDFLSGQAQQQIPQNSHLVFQIQI